ncbi:hypothetical protein [Ferruginibacter profundus]
MTEDLITSNFVDNINRLTIKKTFWLAKFILILVIVYTIVDLIDWYIAIVNSWGRTFKYNSTFYEYRILPVVAVILLAMGVIGAVWHIKANKLIDQSFEKADADLFNLGYQFYYQSAKLSLVAFCISIASIIIRLLLKQLP